MTEPAHDLCELTARYFDGEAGADEARALDHLATCARCQHELGDLMGVEVALARSEAAAAAPVARTEPAPATGAARPSSRRWWLAGGALAAAAAAVVVVTLRRDGGSPSAPAPAAIALAEQRAVEVRFTAPAFDRHRPFAAMRGGGRGEAVPLSALAELERVGDGAGLIAATALRGDVAAAGGLLERRAPSADRDADAAALALLDGRPEDALIAADRALAAGAGTVARWNRALALRDLGFGLVAAAELDRVAAAGEAGWSDEARATAAVVRAPLEDRRASYAAFTAAGEAMIDRTGPALAVDEVRRRPGHARSYFLDALRGATTADEARALAPLATALDDAAGTRGATDALDATLALDLPRRAPLARAYRDLLLRRMPADQIAGFVDRLERGGAATRDLWIGALIRTETVGAHLPAFTAFAEARRDPWYLLRVVHARATAAIADGARDRAEVTLREGLTTCDARAWGLLCARLAMDLATLYGGQSRYADASEWARRAATMLADVGAAPLEDYVLSYVAEIERGRGRLALAAAAFDELGARIPDSDCTTRRYVRAGLAIIAAYRGDAARAGDPGPADACDATPYGLELVAMVDLARLTAGAAEIAQAKAWLTQARTTDDRSRAPAIDVADDVLALATGADAKAGLAAHLAAVDVTREEDAAVRTWGYGALIDRLAVDGDWAGAAAAARREAGLRELPPCTLIASVDRAHGVAIAVDGAGQTSGFRTSAPTPEAWDGARLVPIAVRDALAGCARVAVLARPPLHGRADLLPAEVAWSFLGDRVTPAAGGAAPRLLIVGDARPPAALGLATLAPPPTPAGATVLRAAAATPGQVLEALTTATYAELHVHGQLDPTVTDGAFLALTAGADQRWALTATDVRARPLRGAPVIVLAACRAASVAPYLHARWSLPDAFLAAGARAVVAPTVDIPDDQAGPFFDGLRARIAAGAEVAAAVAAARAEALARGQAWAAGVVVFE